MLICILSIPTILIIRLIMYRKARKQLREFIQLTKNRLKSIPGLVVNCVTHRGESYSWSPDDTGTEVPYFAADDSEGVPSSVEQSENSDSD